MNNQQKDFTKQDNKEIDSQNFKDFENKNEERYEDDNWENYSDYDSNEEQTYQGDKIKKEQITSIIGNKSKHSSTDVSDRKKTYDSSKSQKCGYSEKLDRKVSGSKYDKREKYGNYANYNTYDKSDRHKGYDKSQKYDNYENYNYYDNYENYDQFDNYHHQDNYDGYDKYEKYDKYQKYPNYSKKYNGHDDYSTEKNNYQNGNKNNYHKPNDNYYDYKNNSNNNAYSHKKNSFSNQQGNASTPTIRNKIEDIHEDNSKDYHGKFGNKTKRGYKKPDTYYSNNYDKGFKKVDSHEEIASVSINTMNATSYSYKNDERDRNPNFKSDIVYNTNNNYARKTSEISKDGDRNYDKIHDKNIKSSFKNNSDNTRHKCESYKSNLKDSDLKDNNLSYKKDSKNFNYKHNQPKRNDEDGIYDGLRKPVFINSNMVRENEATLSTNTKESEATTNKIPITGLLNVPLNKIDEKIMNSKDQYVQNQLHMNNLNNKTTNRNHTDTLIGNKKISETKEEEIDKHTEITVNNKETTNIITSAPVVNNKLNTNIKTVEYQNVSIQNTQNYPYQTPNQYNNNYHKPIKNVNLIKNIQNASNINNYYANITHKNLPPPNFNPQYHNPSSLQNPLANYYANNNYSMSMMQNYYSQSNHVNDSHKNETEEIDLKQFTDKLNLNAKVFIPKKNIENKFDNCTVEYPDPMKQYYRAAPKMQTQNFGTYENKFD